MLSDEAYEHENSIYIHVVKIYFSREVWNIGYCANYYNYVYINVTVTVKSLAKVRIFYFHK
jgi:hypothetical protein